LDTACDRLAYVLRRLFELALVRMRLANSNALLGDTSGSLNQAPPAAFQNALRRAHDRFVLDLTVRCKELVKHHLVTSTSPFALSSAFFQTMDTRPAPLRVSAWDMCDNEENAAPVAANKKNDPEAEQEDLTPREPLAAMDDNGNRMKTRNRNGRTPNSTAPPPPTFLPSNQAVVEETPSPMQGGDEAQARRASFAAAAGRSTPPHAAPADEGSAAAPAAATNTSSHRPTKRSAGQPPVSGRASKRGPYNEVCQGAEALFDRIRRYLAQDVIPTALRSGFLTPCHDQLRTAVLCELFACPDNEFLNKFSVAGELDRLKAQRELHSSLCDKMIKTQRDIESISHDL
jgi:hypothetical protein